MNVSGLFFDLRQSFRRQTCIFVEQLADGIGRQAEGKDLLFDGVVEFSSQARRWKRGATAMTEARRRDALRWIDELRAGGATEMHQAIVEALQPLEEEGLLRLPRSPAHTDHNSHMFYVLFPAGKTRDRVMTELKSQGIHAIFHYIPLHSSPMGQQLGYREADLPVTERISRCILRLPFYNGITIEELDRVIESIYISVGARVPALAG